MNAQKYVENINGVSNRIIKMKDYLTPLTGQPRICIRECQFLFAKSCGWKCWEEMQQAHQNIDKLPNDSKMSLTIVKSNIPFVQWENEKRLMRDALIQQISNNFPDVGILHVEYATTLLWPEVHPASILDVQCASCLPIAYIKDRVYVDTAIEAQYLRFVDIHILPNVACHGGIIFCYEDCFYSTIEKLTILGATIALKVLFADNEAPGYIQDNLTAIQQHLSIDDNSVMVICSRAPDENLGDTQSSLALLAIKKQVLDVVNARRYSLIKHTEEATQKILVLPYEAQFYPLGFGVFTTALGLAGWGFVAGGSIQDNMTNEGASDNKIAEWVAIIANVGAWVRFEQEEKGLLGRFTKRKFLPVMYSKRHAKNKDTIVNSDMSCDAFDLSLAITEIKLRGE